MYYINCLSYDICVVPYNRVDYFGTQHPYWRRRCCESEMAQAHQAIGPFNADQDDWVSYIERLQFYFEANDVKDAGKQRALPLSNCGAATYSLIKNLATPKNPIQVTFKDLVALVKDHYHPQLSIIMERFQFISRTRQHREAVGTFVAELMCLSQRCEFGNVLDDMLRDRIVCGINDQAIQKQLLLEAVLDFAKAKEVAIAMESADHHARELHHESTSIAISVQKLQFSNPGPARQQKQGSTRPPGKKPDQGLECYRCGGPHKAPNCKFKNIVCFFYKKKGHYYSQGVSISPKDKAEFKRSNAHDV